MSVPSSVAEQEQPLPSAEGEQRSGAGPRRFLPSRSTRDVLWLLVVSAFVVVLLASVGTMSAFVFIFPASQTPQVLLILFTAAAGFLGGLFAPSPFGINQTNSASEEGANMPG